MIEWLHQCWNTCYTNLIFSSTERYNSVVSPLSTLLVSPYIVNQFNINSIAIWIMLDVKNLVPYIKYDDQTSYTEHITQVWH